jgi:hypothetical protein
LQRTNPDGIEASDPDQITIMPLAMVPRPEKVVAVAVPETDTEVKPDAVPPVITGVLNAISLNALTTAEDAPAPVA